jgi:hypothetical protein
MTGISLHMQFASGGNYKVSRIIFLNSICTYRYLCHLSTYSLGRFIKIFWKLLSNTCESLLCLHFMSWALKIPTWVCSFRPGYKLLHRVSLRIFNGGTFWKILLIGLWSSVVVFTHDILKMQLTHAHISKFTCLWDYYLGKRMNLEVLGIFIYSFFLSYANIRQWIKSKSFKT